jgi:hypothetical protein
MKRRATVDAKGERLFVSSWWATEGAYPAFVQGDWAKAVDESVSDTAVGRLIRSALAESRDGVPFPDFQNDPEPDRRRRALFKLAGVRSETQYAQGARHAAVALADSDSELKITPHRNGGRRTGFTEMLDQVITLDAGADDAALGAAVRHALAISTDGT